jgi:uroporphyrinogen-III synthase
LGLNGLNCRHYNLINVLVLHASEFAEIITLIYNKESYTFFSGNLRKETLPEALKTEGIAFNEIVYQTTLAPFKISDQERWNNVFSPSAVETFDKQQNQNEICFLRWYYHCKS